MTGVAGSVARMAAIEVEGLRKSYGSFEAVRGISFSVDEGEVVAVLGPNGAGKTSTVEILEGYRRRDAGRVCVLGADPADAGLDFRQDIGIVLQSCGVDRYLTVREVLAMYAEPYRHPRRIDEVLAVVGLEEKADSRVKTLSGGQQRRLDLALGLVGDPQLVFLDEPTTGFDPSARRQAWDVVRNLCRLGKTVLLTTHAMDEAQALADRVIVIVGGEIVAEGRPDEIGGRADADAQIRFTLPAGVSATDLPVPAVAEADGSARVDAREPTAVLHQLTSWALGRGEELANLTVSRPSLEDVYLRLTADEPEEPTP
ncbi:MAG: transporter [Acidimicrobiales bacterium]|nr:transporter [Acidimicrobiales bacterium]